jgi:hypothetical protein
MSENLSAARHVDRVCDRFEAACKAGQRPRVEDYLADAPAPERAAFLLELVPLEIAYRLRRGDDPGTEEYRARFPALDPTWVARQIADLAPEGPPAPPARSGATRRPGPSGMRSTARCPRASRGWPAPCWPGRRPTSCGWPCSTPCWTVRPSSGRRTCWPRWRCGTTPDGRSTTSSATARATPSPTTCCGCSAAARPARPVRLLIRLISHLQRYAITT